MSAAPVFVRDDRLYVNIPKEGGQPFTELVRSVSAHAAKGYEIDWTALKEAFLFARGKDFPIGYADPAELLNEKIKVRFSPDFITAYMILFPPKQRGRRLGEHEVRELITAYGVDDDLLDLREMRTALLRRDYGEPIPVAVGAKPVDAEPYSVAWDAPPTDPEGFVRAMTGMREIPPQVLRVVRPAQVAGKRIKPLPGRPGYTVRGDAIDPKPGEDPFKLGEGLRVSPNGAMVLATTRGHLRISGDHGIMAEVVPVLELEGMQGLDAIAKNFFYPGSVIINGDLETSAQIKVLGDIEVRGAVIGAGIEVCGSLIVRDGIINNDRFGVVAGGLVSAGFFERARVWAHTVHIRRYSLHSKLLAIGGIVGAQSCSLNGGDAEAGQKIDVSVLGSANSSPTRVALGSRPHITMRDVFKGWQAMLDQHVYEENTPDKMIAAEAARLKGMITILGGKVRLEESFIRAVSVYHGVKIVIGSGIREPGERLGHVRFCVEKIGDKERVAMTKLAPH